MKLRLGVDIACRTPNVASLADETGKFLWSGRRFRTRTDELEQLWELLPKGAEITVVIEPTRNAWVPLAAWFQRKGATVIMVPSEQSADLRDYYAKHTKSDRIDSKLLATLPLLHPEGLRPIEHLGPAEPLRRATRMRTSLVKRRSEVVGRIDALLEILGPTWHTAFEGKLDQITPLRFLAAGYGDPHLVKRLGKARVARFMHRHSHGRWSLVHAASVLDAASETLALWGEQIDYGELADDIAVEADLALKMTTQIHELDQRIDVMRRAMDPADILRSVPGVGSVGAAQILARLADPGRFRSLAGVRSYSGLVPSLDASGRNGGHGGPTKSGDALLREALFMSANMARRIDPTLAQRYHRLMTQGGKHHNSALCSIAPTLLSRIVACWRSGQAYVIRDLDGTVLTAEQGRKIVSERYVVHPEIRALRRTTKPSDWTSRRSKESQSAPSTGPSSANLRERMRSSA
jgi:transposase